MRRLALTALALILAPAMAAATPVIPEHRLHPTSVPGEPSFVQRVEPAIVGLRVKAAEGTPSSVRLGSRRFGSGVVFDARGYVLTVGYVVMDAVTVEARLRDGRSVGGQVVGFDLESGLAIVKLDGGGPWPTARLGDSRDVVAGHRTATVGVDEDDDLVYVTGSVQAIRRFAGSWEYMLDRALIVEPSSPSWGGSAVVDDAGRVIGMASLRIGDPHVNLAIPIEMFTPVKDEIIVAGRVVSRPPRPWLGLHTVPTPKGLLVEGFSPAGPAATAGFRPGDRIVALNGVTIGSQEHFYEVLWRGQAGDIVRVAVQREEGVEVIAVESADRYGDLRLPASQ